MPIFKVSQKAEDDLFSIGKYTEEQWGIDQRNKYLDEINQRFHQLADNPEYPTSKARNEIKQGIFSLLINEHVIIYRKASYGVRIIRVLNQSMDLKIHL
jgi:toxin ParE1/3/4